MKVLVLDNLNKRTYERYTATWCLNLVLCVVVSCLFTMNNHLVCERQPDFGHSMWPQKAVSPFILISHKLNGIRGVLFLYDHLIVILYFRCYGCHGDIGGLSTSNGCYHIQMHHITGKVNICMQCPCVTWHFIGSRSRLRD